MSPIADDDYVTHKINVDAVRAKNSGKVPRSNQSLSTLRDASRFMTDIDAWLRSRQLQRGEDKNILEA